MVHLLSLTWAVLCGAASVAVALPVHPAPPSAWPPRVEVVSPAGGGLASTALTAARTGRSTRFGDRSKRGRVPLPSDAECEERTGDGQEARSSVRNAPDHGTLRQSRANRWERRPPGAVHRSRAGHRYFLLDSPHFAAIPPPPARI